MKQLHYVGPLILVFPLESHVTVLKPHVNTAPDT